MKYCELNLKKIREDNDLDFAHYTYKRGMCSCCYGPKDLPSLYWRDRVIPKGYDYTYLLFKNADNGSGTVKKTDEIKDYQCIGWRFPIEKLEKICDDLQKQLGDDYIVLVPNDESTCITIFHNDSKYLQSELNSGRYRMKGE